MTETTIQKVYQAIRDVLVYKEPEFPSRFVLDEHKPDDSVPSMKQRPLVEMQKEFNVLLRSARRLAVAMEQAKSALESNDAEKLKELSSQLRILERQHQDLSAVYLAYESGKTSPEKQLICSSLDENVKIIEKLYGLPDNKDIIMRSFEIRGPEPQKAMLVYLDGMVDKQILNLTVIQPLMYFSQLKATSAERLLDVLVNEYLPANHTSQATDFMKMAEGVNSGDTALLIEGISAALIIDSKGYKQRSVDRPQMEQTVRGAQVAFSEGLRTNTGLMRSMMQTNDLVTEIIMVGSRIPQKCALMYLRSIANPTLVAEVKRRIQGISTDYILNVGMLEQFIEDHPSIPLPQTLSTERPDRVAAALIEGRLALFMEGSPFSHILPVSLFNFFHSTEDWTLQPLMGDFMRLLRWVGTLLTLTLPSLYLAISYFHPEAMPTELILAVAAAREQVPFPAIFEVLMMEFSFELIREAGLRVPGFLGSTIGIVGAIILGQAAVAANMVSPIMVVIIAITGLASFVIPEYRIAFGIRLLRFMFVLLSVTLGLVGLALGMMVVTVVLCSMKSFGVPYMVPVGPRTIAGLDVVLRGKVFSRESHEDSLNTQVLQRQPKVSRLWKK